MQKLLLFVMRVLVVAALYAAVGYGFYQYFQTKEIAEAAVQAGVSCPDGYNLACLSHSIAVGPDYAEIWRNTVISTVVGVTLCLLGCLWLYPRANRWLLSWALREKKPLN